MATYRVHKDDNYSVINNEFLKRDDLSWKAKGILAYLLHLPDDWALHFNELKKHATDGKTSLRSGINELRDKNYITYKRYKDKEGKFVHEYDIYEFPQTEKPDTENQNTGNPDTDNRDILLSTNELSTNKPNTKNSNKPSAGSDKVGDEFSIKGQDENGYYIYPEEFEEIWEVYPRNNCPKKAGYKKWAARRREGISQEKLFNAAEKYKKVCERDQTDIKFVKHFKTFFGANEHWKEMLERDIEKDSGTRKVATNF